MNTPSISTNGLSQIESLSFSSKEDILQLNLTFLITDVKPKEINNKTIYHLSLNDNNKTLSHNNNNNNNLQTQPYSTTLPKTLSYPKPQQLPKSNLTPNGNYTV